MDFPLEILGALGSGLVGFLFKAQANAMDALERMNELQIKKEMAADQLANSAAERSSPKARKILAFILVGGIMFGLLFVGISYIWNEQATVSLVSEAPQKELLWGLIRWGGGQSVTVAKGFVLPPWTGWVISIVVGFFFGTGAAKPAR